MKNLQKMLASAIVITGLTHYAFANESGNNGAFIGIHTGATIMGVYPYIDGNKVTTRQIIHHKVAYNIGVKAGYQHFFHPVIGLRGYLSYDFNSSRIFVKDLFGQTPVKSFITYHNIAANADLLINFFSNDSISIGAYAGFGLGYGIDVITGINANLLKTKLQEDFPYNGFNIPVNLGFTLTLFNHHQIELGAKIPTLAARYVGKELNHEIHINPYMISIGYSYVF